MDSGLIYLLDLMGVAVFAVSGVIIACRSRMDPFGVMVLATVTAIGGGTLRDLVLGDGPVFWVNDPHYLAVILGTVMVSLTGFHWVHRLSRVVIPVADAFGLALFTVIGVNKALLLGKSGLIAVVMGVMTGVAGGMLRDLLAKEIPLVLQREVYATASILGGILYVLAIRWELTETYAILLSMAGTLILRLSAIRWRLSLPVIGYVTLVGK